jgi:GNAT superfamily N-acetyltransferase
MIRAATAEDHDDVLRVLEGALLDVAPERVDASVARGETLVAERTAAVGALVRDGERVVAVAVTPSLRGRGVGRALVERAHADAGRLVATFDPRVRGFYEALGFAVEPTGEGRLRGVRA